MLQVAALAPDELVGDNQYFCDFCAAKCDADRRMRLRSLPPYLCLALQRFTYDQEVSRLGAVPRGARSANAAQLILFQCKCPLMHLSGATTRASLQPKWLCFQVALLAAVCVHQK